LRSDGVDRRLLHECGKLKQRAFAVPARHSAFALRLVGSVSEAVLARNAAEDFEALVS
jgi:hypothetical protein